MKKYTRFIQKLFIMTAAFASCFLGGVSPVFSISDNIYKDLEVFTRLIEIVDKQYVDEVDEHEMIEGAIRGMLSSLDPHTVYMAPDMYRDFKSDTSGKFGGVGIEITLKGGVLTVVSPVEDTPAYMAGIQAEDRILKIDGHSTKGMSLMDAVHMMRGTRGKKVVLNIWREGFGKPRDFVMIRDVIKVASIKYESLEDGYVYVRITNFQQKTGDELKAALKEYEKSHGAINGIILDLRNNPGGLLSEAVRVSDLFLSKGVIVSTKGRDHTEEFQYAKTNSSYEKTPLVVLINKGSASASEIVAGALQDTGRAKILGTDSFGKGSVQTIIDLGNKAALKITIAKYYTPKGKSIEGLGIVPDIALDAALYLKQYPNKGQQQENKNETIEGEDQDQDQDQVQDDSSKATPERPSLIEFQKQKAIEYLMKKKRIS